MITQLWSRTSRPGSWSCTTPSTTPTYVAGANTALEQLAEARAKGEFGNVPKLSKDLAFHLGGHTNHSIFWKNLSPEGGDKPPASWPRRSTTSSVPSTRSAATTAPRR